MKRIGIIALCALLAGCGPSPQQMAHLQDLTARRDSGTITWSAWADDVSAYAYSIRDVPPDVRVVLAKQAVVAERVDAGKMTKAEGKLAITQMWADLDAGKPAASAVVLGAVGAGLQAAGQTPQPVISGTQTTTTVCTPSANGANVTCVSR